MGFFDRFKKRKTCDHDAWSNLSPKEVARAQEYYSDRLGEVMDTVVGPTLEAENPTYGQILRQGGIMPLVDGFPMPATAVAIPRSTGTGRMIYGYTWDQIDSMTQEDLANDLLEIIRLDLLDGEF